MLDIPPIALFTIEDIEVRNLNGGITKKFTSLSKSPVTYTTIYDPTIFRWKFGDEKGPNIYTETTERVIHHTYKKSGTYLVQHQACNFCACSDWNLCYQAIDVAPPKPNLLPLAIFGGMFFLLIKEEKKKCKKGYVLKKVKGKYVCVEEEFEISNFGKFIKIGKVI